MAVILRKLTFWAVTFIVMSSTIVSIWLSQTFITKCFVNIQQNRVLQNQITECLQRADSGTYEEFIAGFTTPDHPCSYISYEPLVRTLGEIIHNRNSTRLIINKATNNSETKPFQSLPCHRHRFVSDTPEHHSLKDSQEVHEFMANCSAHAPKLISFPGRVRRNNSTTEEKLLVPNIVHYVWFSGGENFTFLYYLSILSSYKYIEPDFIYIHGDREPIGGWWDQTLRDVPNIYLVFKQRPGYIFGKEIKKIEHSADIARFEIINDYGGIYLDTDVLVVKSFDPLRKFNLTLGRENPNALSNGIIIARRGAPFFRIWMETYRTFNPNEWGEHSVTMTGTLQKIFPTLVHVEEGTLISPNYRQRNLLYEPGYDWSLNYAVHIWKRHRFIPDGPEGIKKLNNTLGELMRHVYFGSKDFMKTQNLLPVARRGDLC